MLGITIEDHVVDGDVHGVIRQRCFYFVGIAFEFVRALHRLVHDFALGGLWWCRFLVLFNREANYIFTDFNSHGNPRYSR